MVTETIDETAHGKADPARALPGAIVVFAGDAPTYRVLPLRNGELVLGRDRELPRDERLSRQHVAIERAGDRLRVRDLDSRNGTFVDGRRVTSEVLAPGPHVLRIGRTLLVVRDDVRRFVGRSIETEGDVVVGPLLADALQSVKDAARGSGNLLVIGESGTGKERAAALFHASSDKPSGPFVVVNCATIPQGVAERLLFGARRGAYSGAENAEGYVQAAERGVLFLDELGELELDVQAKFLRVLEAREVLPLGGTAPKKIDVRFCFATHRDLRAQVAAGKFRADLYHRIVHPEVVLPPLRERIEDVGWLIARELVNVDRLLSPHVRLVETCMLRPWPGNVRELLQQIRRAATAAKSAGETVVGDEHLDPRAGTRFEPPQESARAAAEGSSHSKQSLEEALARNEGNVAATARALGLHRTQLYRYLRRFGIGSNEPSSSE